MFADARHGFTLASIDGEIYPAATVDGGRTWRVDGPVFHISAAAAPVSLGGPGVAGPRTYFASEGLPGGTTVVDVTTDSGRSWWQALLPGGAVFVGAFDGELTAIVAPRTELQGAGAPLWAYQSKTGIRWTYAG